MEDQNLKYLSKSTLSSKYKIDNNSRIAIVRTDRLGDMILTMPMCAAIKDVFPNARVSMIARKYTISLIENSNVIDECLYIDDYENGINDIFKEKKFDAVFFPRPRFDECFAGFRAGIRLRAGSAYRLYSVFMNQRVKDHRKISKYHEAEYNTRLISAAIGREVETKLVKPYIDIEALEKTNRLLAGIGIDKSNPIAIIHPGSGGSAKDWAPENFGLAANQVLTNKKCNVIITGTEQESESCRKVGKECPSAVNLCGRLNLEELIALVSEADVLAANSTGVLHIAAALDIPVVGLYPNTPHLSAKRWGPYSDKAIIVCPPDVDDPEKKDDMSLISVESVAEAIVKGLSNPLI